MAKHKSTGLENAIGNANGKQYKTQKLFAAAAQSYDRSTKRNKERTRQRKLKKKSI